MPKKLTKILGELLRVASYAIKTGIGILLETYQHSDDQRLDQDRVMEPQSKAGAN